MATASSDAAPAIRRCISKTPSGNPLPRRGQVKQRIVKDIAGALATAAVLACDRAAVAGKKGAGAKKK